MATLNFNTTNDTFRKLQSSTLKVFYKWRKGIHWNDGMNTKKAIAEGRR